MASAVPAARSASSQPSRSLASIGQKMYVRPLWPTPNAAFSRSPLVFEKYYLPDALKNFEAIKQAVKF